MNNFFNNIRIIVELADARDFVCVTHHIPILFTGRTLYLKIYISDINLKKSHPDIFSSFCMMRTDEEDLISIMNPSVLFRSAYPEI